MNWKKCANQEFSTPKELFEYQKKVKENEEWKQKEQKWIDKYLQPLLILMGDPDIFWKSVVKNGKKIELYGIGKNIVKKSRRNIPMSENPQAYFSQNPFDESGHWYSRKPNEKKWFDSYTVFQILGTNQFCQTFALMYLANELPFILPEKKFSNYYIYTKQALLFIQKIISESKILNKKNKEMYLKKVKECTRHSNICLNAIDIKHDSFRLK